MLEQKKTNPSPAAESSSPDPFAELNQVTFDKQRTSAVTERSAKTDSRDVFQPVEGPSLPTGFEVDHPSEFSVQQQSYSESLHALQGALHQPTALREATRLLTRIDTWLQQQDPNAEINDLVTGLRDFYNSTSLRSIHLQILQMLTPLREGNSQVDSFLREAGEATNSLIIRKLAHPSQDDQAA